MVGFSSVYPYGCEVGPEAGDNMEETGDLYWFRGSLAQVRCGVVYGDGNNQTQLQLRNAFIQNHQQWWPVLFVPCDGMQLAVYCQDQALSNSKPWRTHPERVVFLEQLPNSCLRIRLPFRGLQPQHHPQLQPQHHQHKHSIMRTTPRW